MSGNSLAVFAPRVISFSVHPNHVKVDHCDRLIEWDYGVFQVVIAPQNSTFFRSESNEDDSLQLDPLSRRASSDRGRTGRIVVAPLCTARSSGLLEPKGPIPR